MNYLFLNPVCTYNGKQHELLSMGNNVYENSCVRASLSYETVMPGCEKVVCRWHSITGEKLFCQLEIRVRSTFKYSHYVIPGVSYNGNNWGKGKEPKNLSVDGMPWVFDYRRTTIPACTISENGEFYLALMASDEDAESLTASCSMVPQADGCMMHRLLYPEIEKPVTYCTRDGYTGAHEEYITLEADEEFVTTVYIVTGTPYASDFAAANVEDIAIDLLGKPFAPLYTTDEAASLACSFAQRLVLETNGRKMFGIGQLPTKEGVFETRRGHAVGWCGQNAMLARLMLERGMETGDESLTEIGLSCLDAWCHEAITKTGLIHANYDWMLNGRSNVEDTCNFGFAICEIAQAWQYMKNKGVDKPKWLSAAKGIADFLIANWSDEHGFGKAWDVETGECIDPEGTIGAYIIPGLTELYNATEEEVYLSWARKACRFYQERDLDRFECTAGALDTYCIDKESSGPILAGSIALYEIDKSDEWLECAKKAGWYFCSWMFHHDTLNSPESDFAVYGYRTIGGTSVSAQHHHIDPWGALVVPQMVKLWKYTQDVRWKKRAQLMWANAIQNMAPKEGKIIHGYFRAAGAQNEGYHHCHWGDEGAPGLINEWLVAWPQAFIWNAATKVDGKDLEA